MVVGAVDRVARHVLQRVVHPAHVPLVAEAQAVVIHGVADPWP